MIAADTSLVVAAFASWHERHRAAQEALAEGAVLIAQCAFETYSVLTRLPAPHRAPPDVVAAFLEARFPDPYLVLDSNCQRSLIGRLARVGVTGGASYDALVAATAAEAGATLVSLDRRAARTYDHCGASCRLVQ